MTYEVCYYVFKAAVAETLEKKWNKTGKKSPSIKSSSDDLDVASGSGVGLTGSKTGSGSVFLTSASTPTLLDTVTGSEWISDKFLSLLATLEGSDWGSGFIESSSNFFPTSSTSSLTDLDVSGADIVTKVGGAGTGTTSA